MEEVNRLKQLAGLNEIKVNQPNMFRKIPLSVVKKELFRDELEYKKEIYQNNGEEMPQEDIDELSKEISSINDYYDLINYYVWGGFNDKEAAEQIFSLLVNKDA